MKFHASILMVCLVLGATPCIAAAPVPPAPNNQAQNPAMPSMAYTVDAQILQLKNEIAKLKADQEAEVAKLKATLAAQSKAFDDFYAQYSKHTHDWVSFALTENTTAATCNDPDICKKGIFYIKAGHSKSIVEVSPPHAPFGKGYYQ